jgi:hypothetical protein
MSDLRKYLIGGALFVVSNIGTAIWAHYNSKDLHDADLEANKPYEARLVDLNGDGLDDLVVTSKNGSNEFFITCAIDGNGPRLCSGKYIESQYDQFEKTYSNLKK